MSDLFIFFVTVHIFDTETSYEEDDDVYTTYLIRQVAVHDARDVTSFISCPKLPRTTHLGEDEYRAKQQQ
jgi:hypothetical protein